MTTLCPCCSGRTTDGLMCRGCWSQLRRDLSSAGHILGDLEVAASKMARLTPPSPGGLASERNPVGWFAAEHAAALGNSLTTWCLDVTGMRLPARAAALQLIAYETTVRSHQAADEMWGDITDRINQARKAIDRPEHRSTLIIPGATCPETGCTGALRAYFPTAIDGSPRVTCQTDPGHTWTTDQWRRLGRRILAADRGGSAA